jgi:hypothetical protein
MLNDSQRLMFIRGAQCAMAKETKFLRKQADKAPDPEISESLLNLARASRTQVDVMKAKRKQEKKRR